MLVDATTKGYTGVYMIYTAADDALTLPILERLGIEALAVVMMNFNSDVLKGIIQW